MMKEKGPPEATREKRNIMKKPDLQSAAFVAPGSVVRGDVTLGEGASIWYNAVLRGDLAPISIGENTNIQDGAVVHVDSGHPVKVGNTVTVGHCAVLHGCTIGDEALIGMGAIILNGAVIGNGCIIGAGALVTGGTVLPDNTLALGSPAKAVRPVRPDERAATVANSMLYVKEAKTYAAQETAEE